MWSGKKKKKEREKVWDKDTKTFGLQESVVGFSKRGDEIHVATEFFPPRFNVTPHPEEKGKK
jgi:hypothetical protein